MLAVVLLKATHTRAEKILDTLRTFLTQFIPRLSYGVDDVSEVSIGLDWEEVKKIRMSYWTWRKK